MTIKGIRYTGPIFDNSGYARACRGNILALHHAGVPITLNPISFEKLRPDLGTEGKLLESLINKPIEFNYNIIHTTPEFWEKHKNPNVKNIGYTIWETTKLHPDWPKYINSSVDKVLVGCEWNSSVFRDSGVTVPIGVVPHGISKTEYDGVDAYNIAGVPKEAFMFYSIFQWTERKHPLAMIKAYYHAFSGNDGVVLVLKTYRSDYSDAEKKAIRTTLQRLKIIMPMEHYPKLVLIPDMLTETEIAAVHRRGDCYVSLDRGEGFGLSPFQAGAAGNPIIVTNFGGTTEYAKEDNSYLVDYQLTPVYGMPWCMSLDSLVKTDEGYVRAKNLREGMLVRNKNLKFKKVNKVEFRPLFEDEVVYSLKSFSFPEKMNLTGQHKLYVIDNGVPVKREVKDINVGDYLFVPEPSLHSHIPSKARDLADTRAKLEDLFYLSGLYLAEGHIDSKGRYVSFAFNIEEKATLGAKCKEIVASVFGVEKDSLYERDSLDRNGYEVYFYNKTMVDFFNHYFSTGSHNKCISGDFKYHDLNSKLLVGYWDGDGHIRKAGYKNKKTKKRRLSPECVAETASFSLAMDLREVLLSLKIVPSVRKSERNDGRISYILSVSDIKFDQFFGIEATRIHSRFKIKLAKGGFGVLVTKKELLENPEEFICSISVEPDADENDGDGGSYILNGIASSNSPWYRGDQCWAEPSITHGSELMKHVYNNREEAITKGKKLQNYIYENFSWECIAERLIKELEEV